MKKSFKNKEKTFQQHPENSKLQDLFEKKIDEMFEVVMRSVCSLKIKFNSNYEVNHEILQRLFFIYIINRMYSGKIKETTKVEIEQFLNRNPKPLLKDILDNAFSLMLVNIKLTQIYIKSKFGSKLNVEPEEYIRSVITCFSSGFFNLMHNLSKKGTELEKIDKIHFNIWGVDFSDAPII
jgi:hypothetical protein